MFTLTEERNDQAIQKFCTAAANGSAFKLEIIILTLLLDALLDAGLLSLDDAELRRETTDCNDYSKPSVAFGRRKAFVCGIENYYQKAKDVVSLIGGMDYAAGTESYDENLFIREVLEFNDRYDGLGTGAPASLFALYLSFNFYWPNTVPLPPRGNPDIEGLIVGQLYDSLTPYTWTQQTRDSFKSATLVTSQGNFHGVFRARDEGKCQDHIRRYLQTGVLPLDGTVCESEFPLITDLAQV